ncbi:MAG TPA: hypothetical protein VK534_00915, partial [Methylomirabilota bacterium]|nr:hypothetical protein [Methylomirabilota bacterium]
MVHYRITRKELAQVQLALFVAVVLQIFTRQVGNDLLPGSQYFIILTELSLAVLIGFTANTRRQHTKNLHHVIAIGLLALISAANISGLGFVLHSLIVSHGALNGVDLLASAVAIFMT